VDTATLITATNLLGNVVSLHELDFDQASSYYNKAVLLSRQYGDAYLEASCLQNLAEIYLKQEKLNAARSELLRSLQLARKISSNGLVFNCLKLLAECSARQLDFNQAYEYLNAYEELRTRYLNENQRRRTNEILKKFENSKIIGLMAGTEEGGHFSSESMKLIQTYQAIILMSGIVIITLSLFVISAWRKKNQDKQQTMTFAKNVSELEDKLERISKDNSDLVFKIEEAERVMQSKSDFLSVITHEIRTPLHAVVASAHLLENAPESSALNVKHIEILKFSSENLLGLINNILDFHRIDAGKIELEKAPFSLRSLLESLRMAFGHQAEEKHIQLVFRVDEALPDAFIGDRLRLSQILNNLLSNAIRFTERGRVVLSVRFRAEDNENNLHFEVEDSGIGMLPEEIKHLKGFFHQANTGISRRFGGSGLGLAITTRILRLMDSELEIVSESGKGSVFSFSLLLKETSPIFLRKITSLPDVPENIACRLLFVEDVEFNRILARHFFEKWGITFDFAETGKEAMDLALKHSYDVILMDIRLPDMSGFEVSGRLREFAKTRDVPIIAMTAMDIFDLEEELQKSGINGVLSKPFKPEDLRFILEKSLKKIPDPMNAAS
jgi:signal transduction histidine kinase/CheY-like chemotaxis protein